MPVAYKITSPCGKIYVGSDLIDSVAYFGSPSSELIARDLTPDQMRDYSARKQILWESKTASKSEVLQREMDLILELRSNDPIVGYNRFPRFKA